MGVSGDVPSNCHLGQRAAQQGQRGVMLCLSNLGSAQAGLKVGQQPRPQIQIFGDTTYYSGKCMFTAYDKQQQPAATMALMLD